MRERYKLINKFDVRFLEYIIFMLHDFSRIKRSQQVYFDVMGGLISGRFILKGKLSIRNT